MFIVAEVDHFEADSDDNNVGEVSFAQISRLGDPHHEKADQDQAVIYVVLFLNHEIGSIKDDVAHDYNADETRVDGGLWCEVTLLSLRIDQLKEVLSLAPRLPSRNQKADDGRYPERIHSKK